MAKPSIFSKDYQKKMKRRKIFIGSTIVLVIVIGGLLVVKKSLTFNTNGNQPSKVNRENKEEIQNNQEDIVSVPKEENKKEETLIEEKSINGPVVDGTPLKIQYEEQNGEKSILSVIGGGTYTYDVSPDKKKVIVIDSKTQDMKTFDIDSGEKNITKASYKTRSGKIFNKDSILKTYPNQIWNEQGKFIDDNTIAYISNLPYFGSGYLDKYIWIVDLKTGNHKVLMHSKSKDIKFKDIDNSTLKVEINGKEKNLDFAGKIF